MAAHPVLACLQRVCVAVTLAISAGGCTSLLPVTRDEVISSWGSYDDAVQSMGSVVPFKTTLGEVHALGLDPRNNPAIKILHFGDLLQRFAASSSFNPQDIDSGIRHCLAAGKLCTGYVINVKKITHTRVGNFWSDSLNFNRETETTGWSVEVVLVFVEDLLVYQLIGGQPKIHHYELHRNPLGPLQGWGDQPVPLVR